jgi:hypothetical protein
MKPQMGREPILHGLMLTTTIARQWRQKCEQQHGNWRVPVCRVPYKPYICKEEITRDEMLKTLAEETIPHHVAMLRVRNSEKEKGRK